MSSSGPNASPSKNSSADSLKTESLATPVRRRSGQVGTGLAVVIAVVLLAVGLGSGYVVGAALTKSSESTVNITEAGSTLLEPLVQLWAPNYTQLVNSHVTVSPGGGGSGKGQTESEQGLVDIGGSDAYVTGSTGVVDIPVAISSQMVVYNLPGLSGTHLNFNATVLGMIYNKQITNWNDPMIQAANPAASLPNHAIDPLVRTDPSGDTFIFSSYLFMGDKTDAFKYNTSAFQASGFSSASGNSALITLCNATQYGITYIGISYEHLVNRTGNLGIANLGDEAANSAAGGNLSSNASAQANYVFPTPKNVGYDADLALARLDFAADGLAISLIMGGSPAGPTTLTLGAGGTYPTTTDPTPYPIANLEYTLVKTSPSDPAHQSYVVQFLQWCIAAGNAEQYLSQVNFVPLTPTIAGLDQVALASVTTSG